MDFLFKTYSIILPKIISRIEKELENKKITLDEKSIKKKALILQDIFYQQVLIQILQLLQILKCLGL
jgi:hypothetical protein